MNRIGHAKRSPIVASLLTLLAASLLLLAPTPVAAQEFRGTILGRVTDPQNGVVPGATVTVTSEKTNVPIATVTETDGAYAVPFLIPGSYRVDASLPGFSTLSRPGITVAIGQRVTVNLQLRLGDVSERVEVIGNAPLLDTTTGGLGQVIGSDRVEAMPLNGRMVFMLNRLAPGVNWQVPTFGSTGTSGLRPFDNSGGSNWSLNGGRVKTNEFLLDGAPDSTRGQFNFSPPVDAVEEFKIQTNTYDAQYGRTGGGVVNMTLKSGANDLHAQVWEFFKDDKLNANNSLNNSLGQPRPPYSAHQYGITATGPIRKDKTFFMATFEGLRERVPFPTTTSVPTEAERNGDFSQSYTDQGKPLVIYDPLTTRLDPATGKYIRDPFPGNVIPANRINPIAKQALAVYPLPNIPGQRLNNFANTTNPAKYDYDAELLRIDHHFSTGSRVFLSLHRNHRDEYRSGNGLQGTFANNGNWPQTRENYGGTFDWVKTLGPKALFNVRVGYTRFTESNYQADAHDYDRALLGFKSLPGKYLPNIELEQFTEIGVGSEGMGAADKTASLQANYTRMFSRHTLKFGGEYRNIRAQPYTTGDANGWFNFTRGFTRKDPNTSDNSTGNSVASFLLGYPSEGRVGGGNERAELWHYFAGFVQEDVRVSRKLTLNLGLRYDYESGVTDEQDRLVRGFAFDQTNPLAAQVQGAKGASECPACSDLRGGLLFAGVNGVPRQLYDPDRNNIQPRVGFAYTLDDKTVVRGGYGLYYQFRTELGSQNGFFVTTPYIANDINGRVGIPELGVNTFANPYPNGLAAAPGASAGLATQLGRGITFDDPQSKVPHIHQYNLTFSREITRNLMFELSYVGSRTHEVPVSRNNINAISAADLARGASYLQQAVTNPFAGLLPGTSRNGATIQRQYLLRPYPEFDGITHRGWSAGKIWYNSLQFLVQKRMSKGLAFTSSYTYSRAMEKTSLLNDQDTDFVEQVTDYDRPHIWVFSGIYELPFGKGKWIGSGAKGLTEGLIGGWQLQWIFNWQSGRPLGQPDLDILGSAKLDNPTPERWFNTCYLDTAGVRQKCLEGEQPVWQQRAPFTLRTTPNRFDDIRVPWKPTLDASLFKTVRLGAKRRLELRFEAFNLTNTVIYPGPSTSFTSANFGKIADPKGTVYFPRSVQIGLKLYY